MFCPYLKGTGIDAQGGHAEYMLMNADATYLIPEKVSYEQAAPMFCAGYTVYGGLRWAEPKPTAWRKAKPGSAPSSQCSRRSEQSASVSSGLRANRK
jgi:NADPH:quinone reductase-like Zn-dependent oxidoreductase